jgi:EAL domain-containing protein (putative c-di-GMP-specific phosphodiesterase class I)
VNVEERRVVGVEALTRASEPMFRNPATLFREAQRQGALWRLERLTRRRALESLPPLTASQLLFLNVEPESIHDPELAGPDQLEAMKLVGLDPQRIVLELTEHAVVRDFASLRESLRRCRDAGFRLAMDDVGSGYAGLQAIAEIGPDFLKVDMSLIRDVHLHPIKRELCATIQRFADSTGVTLVAEGVETREELASLTATGVRCVQGYLFARPDKSLAEPDWDTLDRATVESGSR